MSVPVAAIWSADPERARSRSGPPPGWPNTPPVVVDLARRGAGSGVAPTPGDRAAPRGRARGRTRRRWRRPRQPSAGLDRRSSSLPRHDVRVGDHEVACRRRTRCPPGCGRTPGPRPCTVDARDLGRRPRSRPLAARAGGPTSGAGRSASNTCGEAVVADERRERLAACRAAPGRRLADLAGDDRAPGLLGRPARDVRQRRQQQPQQRRARRPRRRPRRPPGRHGGAAAGGQLGVEPAAEDEPERLADERRADQRRPTATSTPVTSLRVLELGQRARAARGAPTTTPSASPTHDVDAGDEAQPVAADGRADGEHDEDEIEQVHGARSTAWPGIPALSSGGGQWVRNPVWATMRWSGRTDWPSTCQRAVEHLERLGHAEAAGRRAPRGAGPTWMIVGRVGDQDAARVQRPARRASRPATARGGRARSGRGRSRRCPRSSRAPRPGSARAPRRRGSVATLRVGPVGEVLAQLVAGRRSAPARSSVIDSAPEPTPDSSTRAPGKMSASIRIGPRSFG